MHYTVYVCSLVGKSINLRAEVAGSVPTHQTIFAHVSVFGIKMLCLETARSIVIILYIVFMLEGVGTLRRRCEEEGRKEIRCGRREDQPALG